MDECEIFFLLRFAFFINPQMTSESALQIYFSKWIYLKIHCTLHFVVDMKEMGIGKNTFWECSGIVIGASHFQVLNLLCFCFYCSINCTDFYFLMVYKQGYGTKHIRYINMTTFMSVLINN